MLPEILAEACLAYCKVRGERIPDWVLAQLALRSNDRSLPAPETDVRENGSPSGPTKQAIRGDTRGK